MVFRVIFDLGFNLSLKTLTDEFGGAGGCTLENSWNSNPLERDSEIQLEMRLQSHCNNHRRCEFTAMPPSQTMQLPVTNDARSDASQITGSATSSG